MSQDYFCDIENREGKELVAGVTARTFWQEKMLISLVDLEPNSIIPLHSHVHEQVGTVIWGEIEFTIGGEKRLLKTGDCYTIPGDVEHMAVAGDDPVRVFEVFAPVREEYK